LHIQETIAQFSTGLKSQADLRVEATHLEILNHNFRSWPHVRFPRPILATESVILETFEPGRIVTSFLDMYDRLADAIREEDDESQVRRQNDPVIATTKPKNLAGAGTVHNTVAPLALVAAGGSTERHPDSAAHLGVPTDAAGAADERVGRTRKEGSDGNVDGEEDEDPIRGYQLIPNPIAKFLVTTGLGIYLKMLLVDNLMHADLHPGNIMVNFHRHYHRNQAASKPRSRGRRRMRHDDSESPHRLLTMVPHRDPYAASSRNLNRVLGICLVDAGMVAQLTDHESSTFIGLLSSLGEGDGASAAGTIFGNC
jgi:hypothetical protein